MIKSPMKVNAACRRTPSLQDLRGAIYGKGKASPGHINLGVKRSGERSAGNLHAAFDEAGAGNATMGVGMRPTAKAVD